ncbi:MAG: hypothetical protein ACOYKE_15620, partial [Ferruginibacter sp.]
LPPVNDDCINAIFIPTDTVCSYSTFSNIWATASSGIAAASCGNYSDKDIWFKTIVPPSGHLVFNSQDLGIGNCSMALYSGNCDSLTPIDCNMNFSSVFHMPYLNKHGLIPGSTIYIRIWRNTNQDGGYFGLCVFEPPPPTVEASCTNLGFENGMTGWYGTLGNPSSGLVGSLSELYYPILFNTTSGPNFILNSFGIDTIGNFPKVFEGNNSLMLGNVATTSTYNASSIEQTFFVTPSNSVFNFHYAVLLDLSYHEANEHPRFQFDLLDSNRNPLSWASIIIGNQCPFILPNGSLPWKLKSIDLSSLIGQKVTVCFSVADCVNLAHDCYAYIDCSCLPLEINSIDTICQGQSTILTAPIGALSYLWSPGGDTTASITVNPIVTSTYSCQVATYGNVTSYNVLTKTIVVLTATTPSAGSNSPICLGQSLHLTSTAFGASGFSWTGPNNFNSSIQNPIITYPSPLNSGWYVVTAHFSNACAPTDSIMVTILPSQNITLNPIICGEDAILVGTHYYSATGTYYDTLQTSFGCDSTI